VKMKAIILIFALIAFANCDVIDVDIPRDMLCKKFSVFHVF